MAPARTKAGPPGLLDGLGLVGLGEIEPVVIAAVAAELPILLVGSHGTGKSLLLTRIAEALGLAWRHYNASLLSYDDLVGYPVPDGHGGLDWLRTPATIWDAEAVFLDEINRCRPELQNKLFPIVHERRVQGIELTRLRHRWSAMNPVDEDAADDAYLGADPLDAALADRFAFIVPMPDWRALAPAEQERLLMADLRPVDGAAADAFRVAVAAARARYLAAVAQPDPASAVYVRHALRLLDDAGLRCSPRRGAMLVRLIMAALRSGRAPRRSIRRCQTARSVASRFQPRPGHWRDARPGRFRARCQGSFPGASPGRSARGGMMYLVAAVAPSALSASRYWRVIVRSSISRAAEKMRRRASLKPSACRMAD